jgi:hypothetical protein
VKIFSWELEGVVQNLLKPPMQKKTLVEIEAGRDTQRSQCIERSLNHQAYLDILVLWSFCPDFAPNFFCSTFPSSVSPRSHEKWLGKSCSAVKFSILMGSAQNLTHYLSFSLEIFTCSKNVNISVQFPPLLRMTGPQLREPECILCL